MNKNKLQQANNIQSKIYDLTERKKRYNQEYESLIEKLDSNWNTIDDDKIIMIKLFQVEVLVDQDKFSIFIKNNRIDFDPEIEKLEKEFDEL